MAAAALVRARGTGIVSGFDWRPGRARLPVLLQSERAECGLACLAMVAAYFGGPASVRELRQRFSISLRGATLSTLMQIAEALGLTPRALRLEPSELPRLRCPAILHWDLNHFVVLKRVQRGGSVWVHNPALGVRRYDRDELSRHFTGVALELTPGAAFRAASAQPAPALGTLARGIGGLWRTALQLLLLGALVQAFALATPLYLQTVVDQVLVRQDSDLLTVLAVGFLLLLLVGAATRALRQLVSLYAATSLGVSISAALFGHLMRLPLEFFRKRSIGDLQSRFDSVKPLQAFLSSGAVNAAVDGVMASTTLALMLLYSPRLTLIVVVLLGAYLLLRLCSVGVLRVRNQEALAGEARQDADFVETLQAIGSIKVAGRESARRSLWHSLVVEAKRAEVALARLHVGFDTTRDLIVGAENVLVVWAGANLVLEGSLTIGMLYAFVAYKNHFNGAVAALVEELIRYRMLGVHLERIADISATPEEYPAASADALLAPVEGDIELDRVSFRYSDFEPPVLDTLQLTVREGETVAILGPSGSGKSTLLRLAMGLLTPTGGTVRVGGRDLQTLNPQRYRAGIGAVTQEDALLSGSILDNVTLFDPEPDSARVYWACAQALIHEDVCSLAMAYQTPIGSLGSSLSAGQRQRLLLARALYRNPHYLFLDEGTAHLDPAAELAVLENLQRLPLTCLLATHSRAAAARADRVVTLG
ncbi:MAG: peptidase domain-containing ABC transporter [Pseudomonadales bacterium]